MEKENYLSGRAPEMNHIRITLALLRVASLRRKGPGSQLVMQYQLGALTTCAAVFVYVFFRRRRRLSAIRDVPGPVNPSWIFGMSPGYQLALFTSSCRSISLNVENPQGHQWYFMAEDAGRVEKRFLESFGNIVRWKGPFGVCCAYRTRTGVLHPNS